MPTPPRLPALAARCCCSYHRVAPAPPPSPPPTPPSPPPPHPHSSPSPSPSPAASGRRLLLRAGVSAAATAAAASLPTGRRALLQANSTDTSPPTTTTPADTSAAAASTPWYTSGLNISYTSAVGVLVMADAEVPWLALPATEVYLLEQSKSGALCQAINTLGALGTPVACWWLLSVVIALLPELSLAMRQVSHLLLPRLPCLPAGAAGVACTGTVILYQGNGTAVQFQGSAVSAVSAAGSATGGSSSGLSTGAIIGIACGGAAVLAILAGAFRGGGGRLPVRLAGKLSHAVGMPLRPAIGRPTTCKQAPP